MLSFVVSLLNRGENFQRMVASLEALQTSLNWELVVADFGSADLDVAEFCSARQNLRHVALQGGFNRSLALNRGAAQASGEKIVFLDADIVVPVGFADLAFASIEPGQAFFPVVYALNRDKPMAVKGDSKFRSLANGRWVVYGYGICGFFRCDIERIGGWDEDFGRSYGCEDNELHDRAHRSLRIIRERVDGLFHLWHPPGVVEQGAAHEVPVRNSHHYRELRAEKLRKIRER